LDDPRTIGHATYIRGDGHSPPSSFFDPIGYRLGFIQVAADDNDIGPRPGQIQDHLLTHAFTPSGNYGNPAGDIQQFFHSLLLLFINSKSPFEQSSFLHQGIE
jgi:hypothetical protein